MRGFIALIPLMLMTGCAAAALGTPAGLSSVASAIEAVGATATGFKTTQSTAALNGADKGLVEAQTAMTQVQVEQSRGDRERLGQERVVTARLLRGMSGEYQEPVFLTLAEWVEAGGDPDFAFKYALAHISEGQTRVLPQQALLLGEPAQTGQVLTSSALAHQASSPVHQAKAPEGASVQARRLTSDAKVDEALDELSLYQGLLLY
jgi:hypothetical protein